MCGALHGGGNCAKHDENANRNIFSAAIHAEFLPIGVWNVFPSEVIVDLQL
jgi:hypothetical protein